MEWVEEQAFTIARTPAHAVCPITHRRYVDDSHDRFSTKRKGEKFLNILNSIDSKIQFTAEYEDDTKSLDFLDTTINNTGSGTYEFKIHRKDAITNVQIKLDSCHDDKVKYGVFKGFVHRAMKICSEKYLKEELEHLVSIFKENGYGEKPLRTIIKNHQTRNTPRNNDTHNFVSLPCVSTINNKLKTAFKKAGFTTIFKSGRNLASIFTSRNKQQLPKNSYPGVYRIPCKCKKRYIGHTGKQVKTRGIQHEKAVFNGNYKGSAVAEHTKTCNAGIDWDNFVTLAAQPQYYRRTIREALEIQREEVGNSGTILANREYGQYVTTNTWRPILKKIGLPKTAKT